MRRYRVPTALVVAGALFALASPVSSAVLITVDKAAQRMTVVVDDELRWTWPVSTGLTKYDTPNGRFTTFRMERKHFSREWDDAPMPHSIFFTQNGHAIHGSYAIRRLGNPASHGCVRLAPKNAAQLFTLVRKHGLSNTQVVVQGALPGAMPIIAVPLPRDRRAALRMVAALETPIAAQRDASIVAESQPGAAAVTALASDKPIEELTASARTVTQRESNAASPQIAGSPVAIQHDTSTAAESEAGTAEIATLDMDKPAEELAASSRIVSQPDESRADSPKIAESDAPVAVQSDTSVVMESTPDIPTIAILKPERPAEGRVAAVRILAQPRERRNELYAMTGPARPVTRSEAPAIAPANPGDTAAAARSPEVPAVEQRQATRTRLDPPGRQAARTLSRPHSLSEPPMQRQTRRKPVLRRARRETPPQYAGRIYDDPPIYQRRRGLFTPHAYYVPRVEIIEEFYVNGQWVRRRYYRPARRSDFFRVR